MVKTVGEFTMDTETGTVTGPAAYMEERGFDRMRAIEAGRDAVFNFGCCKSPDVYTAVLVSLQTDYAGWKGTRQLLAGLKGREV